MRKWSMIMKKMAVLFLSAALISMMIPVQLRAQEQSVQDKSEIGVQSVDGAETSAQSVDDAESGVQSVDDAETSVQSGDYEEPGPAAAADDMTGGEKTLQAMGIQDTDSEKETDDLDNDGDAIENEKNQDDIGTDDKTEQPDEEPEDEQQAKDPIAVPILMDSSNELYGSLSQFLLLSSDQFQVYTVAVIDPMTQQPVQPDSPVETVLDVPSGYDTDRVVVSEISMSGETPVRAELTFTYDNGKAVFETDHSGIYVVMEKKVQPQLPDSLEMTSQIEKLELTKKYPDSASLTSSAGNLTSSVRTLTFNPQTGDDHSVLIWGIVTAAAAAAVIALVVIIIKRRK